MRQIEQIPEDVYLATLLNEVDDDDEDLMDEPEDDDEEDEGWTCPDCGMPYGDCLCE